MNPLLKVALLCLMAATASAEESSKIELPPTPEELEPEACTRTAEVRAPPVRRQGLSVGVRGEMDVLGFGATPAVIPAVGIGYSRESLGSALTVLVQSSPGLRAEGRFHPLTQGWVRPYVGVGATAFFREQGEQGAITWLGGVSGRGVFGVEVPWTSRLFGFADVAYERFFTGGVLYGSQSVLLSVGVGLFP